MSKEELSSKEKLQERLSGESNEYWKQFDNQSTNYKTYERAWADNLDCYFEYNFEEIFDDFSEDEIGKLLQSKENIFQKIAETEENYSLEDFDSVYEIVMVECHEIIKQVEKDRGLDNLAKKQKEIEKKPQKDVKPQMEEK